MKQQEAVQIPSRVGTASIPFKPLGLFLDPCGQLIFGAGEFFRVDGVALAFFVELEEDEAGIGSTIDQVVILGEFDW